MYYRLKGKYCLRGWELLPYAIVDSETHRARFVEKAEFDALSLCDGTVDLALPLIPESVRSRDRRHAVTMIWNRTGKCLI